MDKFEIAKQLEVVKTKIQREQWDIAESVLSNAINYILHSSPNDDNEMLRDHFAGQALSKMTIVLGGSVLQDINAYAATAYKIADAMMEQRNERFKPVPPASASKINISDAIKSENF